MNFLEISAKLRQIQIIGQTFYAGEFADSNGVLKTTKTAHLEQH